MKRLKLWLLLPACILLLTGCGGNHLNNVLEDSPAPSVSPEATAEAPHEVQEPPATVIVLDDSMPPKEGMQRSPLTYEWVDAQVAETRPIAVMIPNESEALPHYSLSRASVVYEANVEGGMTRMLGIFEDWQDLDPIGNIRSLRTYYVYWAFEWDAFLVHFGGPFFVDDLLAQDTTENVDGNLYENARAFFRTNDREAPHNAFATGTGLLAAIEDHDYSLTYRGLSDESHFRFTSKAEPNTLGQYGSDAVAATYIDMSSCYPLTRCRFEYNAEDGLYYRYQHVSGSTDGPHMDAATGEQLTFKNILVQYIQHEELGEGYMDFQCLDTTRDGWYFTNGRGIHVRWEKTSDYGATRFYDDDGEEITVNAGKTMILIVREGDSFLYY